MIRDQVWAQPGILGTAAESSKLSRALASLSSRLHGYLPALAAFGCAGAMHALTAAIFGQSVPGSFLFLLYLLAFLIAAWCGYGPGLLITALITCGVPYLVKPGFSIRTVDVGGVAIFLLLSLIISSTAAGRKRSELLLRRMNEELDRRVSGQTTMLRHHLAELETLYSELSIGLCFLSPELRFLRVNDMFASISGVSVENHLGRELREILSEDVAYIMEPVCQRVLQTGQSVLDYEVRSPSARGSDSRFWSIHCSAVKECSAVNEGGRVLGLQALVQDITERKRAERALAEANVNLKRANEDLEHFAYSASHDLQEPLRTVAIYSQMLKKKFGGALGADGDMYIGFTVEGALKMRQLVTDLLTYTQASLSDTLPEEPVNAGEAVESALANLQIAISESDAVITFPELPRVPMHKVHLVQLFQNLIGNAIKYRKQDPPQISIMATRHDGAKWLWSVRDNGIGIDPEYQTQVFGIFKRLHAPDEGSGTGMGLAICRRIVERHGGHIWVESTPGEGATFLFTLPGADSPTLRAQR